MTQVDGTDRVAGAALVIGGIGTVIAMSHHPTRLDSGAIAGVHGTLIALLILMSWGFLHFAFRRGAARPLIMAGLLAYALGLFGHMGAVTINGFAMPALASRGPINPGILLFAWEVSQALARLGVVMTGLAYLAWSVDLVADRDPAAKATAALGIVAGAVPPVLLLLGLVAMDVAGALLVYAIHAAWAALLGVQLFLGRLGVEGEEPSPPIG